MNCGSFAPEPCRRGGHIDADGDRLFHVCGSDRAIDLRGIFYVVLRDFTIRVVIFELSIVARLGA